MSSQNNVATDIKQSTLGSENSSVVGDDAPELGSAFFDLAIITRPGEDLIAGVCNQRAAMTVDIQRVPSVQGVKWGLQDTLTGWVDGPPGVRDDGGLAIVQLHPEVEVDGQNHLGYPIIVSRWSAKIKTTGSGIRLSYDDVIRHIDISKD